MVISKITSNSFIGYLAGFNAVCYVFFNHATTASAEHLSFPTGVSSHLQLSEFSNQIWLLLYTVYSVGRYQMCLSSIKLDGHRTLLHFVGRSYRISCNVIWLQLLKEMEKRCIIWVGNLSGPDNWQESRRYDSVDIASASSVGPGHSSCEKFTHVI